MIITFVFMLLVSIKHCYSRTNELTQLLNTSNLNISKSYPNLLNKDPLGKIHGVSLGGWLVTEPWITPTLYESLREDYNIPKDEFELCLSLGKLKSETFLNGHYSTFYTENDFKEISKMGLNLVRIPIGYWAFGLLFGDSYVQGQEKYLDLALEWCQKYHLKVQIDLHALPESQNGYDNSGKTTDSPKWLSNRKNVKLTYKIVDYVLNKYGNNSIVHSIQMVNEPLSWKLNQKRLMKFYNDLIEKFVNMNLSAILVLHDAFYNMEAFKNYFRNVYILDHHLYEIFTEWQIEMSLPQHLDHVEQHGDILERTGQKSIIGEFSGALTDCTKYINGVGKGSRWDGSFYNTVTNKSCEFRDDISNAIFKDETAVFLQKQMYTYEEKGDGWIFWTYKTENSLDWDFRRLYENGMLPDPFKKDQSKKQPRDYYDDGGRKTIKKETDFDNEYELGFRKSVQLFH